MQINAINNTHNTFGSFGIFKKRNKIKNGEKNNQQKPSGIRKKGMMYGAAALAALNLAFSPIQNVQAKKLNSFDSPYQIYSTEGINSNVTIDPTPVSEFYLTDSGEEKQINPNADIERNSNGTLLAVITPDSSERANEGATLGEVISKVYSNALSSYEGEQKTAIFNKLIDETLQANPEVAQYVKDLAGGEILSYQNVADMNLYRDDNNAASNTIIIPEAVVYLEQGVEPENAEYIYSSEVHTPKSDMASIIKDTNELNENEYSSISDMIYGEYGEDISDEAYRDILYSIVNNPINAEYFETTVKNLNLNQLLQTESITDLNRTLDENTNKTALNIYLPEVTTLKTSENGLQADNNGGNEIVYQISPAEVEEGQNDKLIILDGKMGRKEAGSVHELKDVLQYYSSPDGQGRFAGISEGKLVLNDIEYGKVLSDNILSQVIYNNLELFTTPYSNKDGYHEFGVFDVNPDYDTTDKTRDEIIRNSTINKDRMYNFSFENFEGNELKLPQFRYVIHEGALKAETMPETEANRTVDNTSETEPQKQTETETQKQTETETQKQTETETQKQTETETQKQTETETQKQTETETQKQTETETQKQTETECPQNTETETPQSEKRPEIPQQTECPPNKETETPQTEKRPEIVQTEPQTEPKAEAPSVPSDNPTANDREIVTPSTPAETATECLTEVIETPQTEERPQM